jgi:hypothetical protein
VRYFKDRDGDIWATDGGDFALCIGEQVQRQAEESQEQKFGSVVDDYGPLIELKSVAVKITPEISGAYLEALHGEKSVVSGLEAAFRAAGFVVEK